MLQPKYTMTGFNWFDRRGTEGVGFVRALRTMLTQNMPSILPELRIALSHNFADIHAKHPVINGKTPFRQRSTNKFTHNVSTGERHSPVYPMVVQLTVLANALSFFGKDLARDQKFMHSALDFIEDTLKTAEIVRLLPKFLAP